MAKQKTTTSSPRRKHQQTNLETRSGEGTDGVDVKQSDEGQRVYYRLKKVTESTDWHPVMQIERCTLIPGKAPIIEEVDKPDIKLMILSKIHELMIEASLTGYEPPVRAEVQ